MKEFRSFTKEIVQDVSYTYLFIENRIKHSQPLNSLKGKWISESPVRTPNTRSQKSFHSPINKKPIENSQSNSLRINRT